MPGPPRACPRAGRRPDRALRPQPPEPLRFPGYRGCVELDTLNEEVVSVYNFEKTFQLDTAVDKPCARYVRPEPTSSRLACPRLTRTL